jgi:hypothetical protein
VTLRNDAGRVLVHEASSVFVSRQQPNVPPDQITTVPHQKHLDIINGIIWHRIAQENTNICRGLVKDNAKRNEDQSHNKVRRDDRTRRQYWLTCS